MLYDYASGLTGICVKKKKETGFSKLNMYIIHT